VDDDVCTEDGEYLDGRQFVILRKGTPGAPGNYDPVLIPKWDTDPAGAPLSWATARLWVLCIGYFWLPLILAKLVNLVAGTYYFTKKLSDQDGAFDVKPLAPDKAGGLSSLATLAKSFVYPMVLFGIMMTMPFIKENTQPSLHNFLLFVPFVPLFFLVFFLPLGGAHKAMKRAKDQALEEFSALFDTVNAQLVLAIRGPAERATEVDRLHTSIRALRSCYERIEKMPVWPFDISVIYRLIAAVLLPATIPILQILLHKWILPT